MVIAVQKKPFSNLYLVTFDLGCFHLADRDMMVVGTFNDWSVTKAMRSGLVQLNEHSPTLIMPLLAGDYEYKYYDAAHREWLEIEDEPEVYRGFHWDYSWNVFGTKNCVLRVLEE